MTRAFLASLALALAACGSPGPGADAGADPGPGPDAAADPGPADDPGDDAPRPDLPPDGPGDPDALGDDGGTAPGDAAGEDRPGGDAASDTDPGIPFPELDPALCRRPEPADWLGFDPAYAPPASGSVIQDKAWFLWTVLQEVPAARAAVLADPDLAALSTARTAAFREAATACAGDAACIAGKLSFGEDDLSAAAKTLSTALAPTGVVAAHLRTSGRFALHAGLDDGGLAAQAAADGLRTLGRAFDDRARGRADLSTLVADASAAHPGDLLFFEPLLHLALAGLAADGRDEAARYEPLSAGENAAALARAATLHWDDWRFTVILVPGWGPDDLSKPLSDTGREHCDIAVLRWQAGLAPFLLFSGGHVHPDRTPYAEALEMKKYVMEAHGVPADAILVDPHARHTTTNLRNAGRLILASGIPPDRPALISTDFLQAGYITALADRCNEELGYVPWRSMAALSLEDDCFLPSVLSLHADARDPLDP